ncbi:hypothetical protein [Streptomyces longwoodensis]|uniref:hypothetical protein n=1 Tax=Streptomyces longwoodensis TaxID=68231 RepID=UPI0036FBF3A3
MEQWTVYARGVAGTVFAFRMEAETKVKATELAYAQHGQRLKEGQVTEALSPDSFAVAGSQAGPDAGLLEVLRDIVAPAGQCEVDGEGHCRAHDWFVSARPCPYGRARAMVDAAEWLG